MDWVFFCQIPVGTDLPDGLPAKRQFGPYAQ